LYTQGLISYPRTETNIFPKGLNLSTLVEQQIVNQKWSNCSKFAEIWNNFQTREEKRLSASFAAATRHCKEFTCASSRAGKNHDFFKKIKKIGFFYLNRIFLI